MSGSPSGMARPEARRTSLTAVVERTPGAVLLGGSDVAVTGISQDSRSIRPGDLFAALPGPATHGAHFFDVAIAAGADAVITDMAGAEIIGATAVPLVVVSNVRGHLGFISSLLYGDPSHHLHVLGVSGSTGKSTVAAMLANAFRVAGVPTGSISDAGVRNGETVVAGVNAQLAAPDLQAGLGVLREQGVKVVAMEVPSHSLDRRHVDGTHFSLVAFTNLAADRMSSHPSMEHYFRAVQRLFTSEFAAKAVVLVDDPWGRRMAAETDLDVITASTTSRTGQWRVDGPLDRFHWGQRFTAVDPVGALHDVTFPLAEPFDVANALVALAVLTELGMPIDLALAGLAGVDVPTRGGARAATGEPIAASA